MKCVRCNGTGSVDFGTKKGNNVCFCCNGTGIASKEYSLLVKMGIKHKEHSTTTDVFVKYFEVEGIPFIFYISTRPSVQKYHCRVSCFYFENYSKTIINNEKTTRDNVKKTMFSAKKIAEEYIKNETWK